MELFILWFIGSIIAAVIADNRELGAGWAFVLSLLLSPLIGIIVALASSKKTDIALQNKLSSTQDQLMKKTSQPILSTADEIKQYNGLLNEGVITQEEFDAKKKQLLGI